jgi:hypothetical protein
MFHATKSSQKGYRLWKLTLSINCDLAQYSKLMAFYPAENPRLKNLVNTILRYYISFRKNIFLAKAKKIP